MRAAARRKPYTRADFLAWEEQQEERWEFVDGIIRMMAGGRIAHNKIAGNIFAALHAALAGTGCTPFQQNQKLAPAVNEDVMYPDVLVVCGPLADDAPTVDRATVVIEVVSKSSAEDDYTRKWDSCREMAELRHYLVVEQQKRSVALFSWSGEAEEWRYRSCTRLDDSVELSAIGVALRLSAIYAGTALG